MILMWGGWSLLGYLAKSGGKIHPAKYCGGDASPRPPLVTAMTPWPQALRGTIFYQPIHLTRVVTVRFQLAGTWSSEQRFWRVYSCANPSRMNVVFFLHWLWKTISLLFFQSSQSTFSFLYTSSMFALYFFFPFPSFIVSSNTIFSPTFHPSFSLLHVSSPLFSYLHFYSIQSFICFHSLFTA